MKKILSLSIVTCAYALVGSSGMRHLAGVEESTYTKSMRSLGEAALQSNLAAANAAIARAEAFYSQPRYDSFTGTWDNTVNTAQKERRIADIKAIYTL